MTIPINFASAQRSGTTETAAINNPGGFSIWSGTLTGMGTGAGSDYENVANSLNIDIFYESVPGSGTFDILYAGFPWKGGPFSFKGVTDPPPIFSFGLGNLPLRNFKVRFTQVGTFTVGLASTVS